MAELNDETLKSSLDVLGSGELTPEQIAEHTASVVGYHYTVDDYYEVGREEIRKHAMAVQDGHPTHWSEAGAKEYGHDTLVAHPTFVSVMGIIAQRKLFDEVVTGYDLWQIMQTDQRLIYHQPMKVGDQLICDVSLDSFRHITSPETVDLMVTKNIICNQYDEPIMTTYTSIAARPGLKVPAELAESIDHVMMKVDTIGDPGKTVHREGGLYRGADPAERPGAYGAIDFDTLSVGQELPPKTFLVSRGNLANYAGIAGDPNPIHFSDHVIAAAGGMEDVVVHGMQTMGLGATYVSEFIGDPAAFCEYNVRFTSPVYVPADDSAAVDFTGKVKSLDPQTRRGTIALTAKQGDRKIFGRATVVVQFN
ncbi:beta-hydroxyacyl-[acyl-carrier-protein] dehydratase HadA/HadB [Gordonia hirsuta DSM 44140 = NBRC 16056]|uniref:Beta-hydroxyacyl-[acyl-carrier-protein] dehydratase HadA/HadB n=1 Tax=Gordonia hirsuta DSM 44140 = NBRC 16056 TaxID=1121927 RepID=L7L6N0_9ACTN|nr:fused (3R)-hydroxyacyl-ACP dehydratase subunits HadA/HadB [Gordonia hirsuta]GAC56574.1 beta-hydroxyacyl-[acyl-carrier-protein] dehydratase HadA/HadB [Gordonia hirsuta DSM 44140 = NBRC 16056]